MLCVIASTTTEIVFHQLVKTKGSMVQCVINYSMFWSRFNTVLLFIHHLVPFVIYVYSFLMIIRSLAKSKSLTQQQSFLITFWKQIKKCKNQIIPPFLIILSALPQIITVFSIDCDQWYNMWVRHIVLAMYLVALSPDSLTFFLFIYPLTVFKNNYS